MKKGEIYEGYVTDLGFPNKGMVCVEGEEDVCVVKNVIPGQVISFRVTKKRHGECEGQAISVIRKATDELDVPECPHFGLCGGCSFQNLSYERQLEIKENEVKKLLIPVLGKDFFEDKEKYTGAKESPNRTGYKNKMEFSFGDMEKGGDLTLGLHRKGSFYDVVPVPECRIVCGDIRKIIRAAYDECKRQGLTFFHKMSHKGVLRHLVVRRSESLGEILVMLVTTSEEKPDGDAFVRALLDLKLEGRISGILHCINDSPADNVEADELVLLYGKDHFYEELLGLRFMVTPFSFFQTNSKGAEVLYDTARSFINEAIGETLPVVYDLYSGTGTIAQLLSAVSKKVIGVEIVEEAVLAARENAKANGLSNCEFIAGDVLKVLDEIEEKPDFIVIDPPRDGIHPKALPKLISYGVEKLIYISCKPTSLARDLPAFLDAGYTVVRSALVDMFPYTANVETVVLMSRR